MVVIYVSGQSSPSVRLDAISLEKSVFIVMCMCLKPTHCTLRASSDGIRVIYFRLTHLLDRPHYVGFLFRFMFTEVRATVCVTVSYCKCVVCGMIMKGREKVKPGT